MIQESSPRNHVKHLEIPIAWVPSPPLAWPNRNVLGGLEFDLELKESERICCRGQDKHPRRCFQDTFIKGLIFQPIKLQRPSIQSNWSLWLEEFLPCAKGFRCATCHVEIYVATRNKHFLDVPAFFIIHCHLYISHPLQSIRPSVHCHPISRCSCRSLLSTLTFPICWALKLYQWVEQLGLWKFWISLCLSTPPGLSLTTINDQCHYPQLGFPDRTTTLESDTVHRTGRSGHASETCPQHSVDTAVSSNGWRYSQSSGQAPLNGEKASLSM